VILGDNIFEDDFGEWVREFEKDKEHDCYIFLREVEDPQRFGVAEIKDGKLVSIEEKPKNPKSNYAVTGMYFYSPRVFEVIRWVIENIGYSARNELEISDVNDYFVKEGTARAIVLNGFWSDAGKFNTLLRSSQFIANKKKGE
jgi:glucose-1-phosphate thymidylyltransferase